MVKMTQVWTVALLAVIALMGFAHAKIQSKVKCLEDTMIVELLTTDNIQDLYLEQLKNYPDVACKPQRDGNKAVFTLSLVDIYKCGITRISNKLTGRRVYYHRIIAERSDGKDLITAKCIHAPVHGNFTGIRERRNVLPAGFQEPEDLEITKSYTTNAPEPILGVAVRQNGEVVTGELNVSPGTPLQMEIFLDKGSAPVYGLLVSYMQVSDTKSQEETIIFNGCSIDPYLFENFNTVDGDFLSAKFRAFKFPESTYVQFRGTVNVCLDKCKGMECNNGQVGFGRRRREVTPNQDENKLFEVAMSTLFQIKFLQDDSEESKIHIIGTRKRNNETITNISGNQLNPSHEREIHLAEVQEEIIDLELMRNAAAPLTPSNSAFLALVASTASGLLIAIIIAANLASY